MGEKRFIADGNMVRDVEGKIPIILTYDKKQLNEFLDGLNELNDENEQLKQAYQKLKHRHGLLHDECLDIECERDSLKKDVESLEKENEQLKHNNKMLSVKMSEVSTKYRLLKEFSEDTNPNEAVKTALHELMMITKEYR